MTNKRKRRPVTAKRFTRLLELMGACRDSRQWAKGKNLKQVLIELRNKPFKHSLGDRHEVLMDFRWVGFLMLHLSEPVVYQDISEGLAHWDATYERTMHRHRVNELIIMALSLPLEAWEDTVNAYLDANGDYN